MTIKVVYKGGKGSGNFGHSGRPGKVGGSSSVSRPNYLPPEQRVWQGEQYDQPRQLTNKQTGLIGEHIATMALEDIFGVQFSTLNEGLNNAPIDIAGDHHAIEVKAGPASNGKSAQHWRATISTEGIAERDMVRRMSKEEKRIYNAEKQRQVIARKESMITKMSEIAGAPIKPATVCVILTPDGKRGDVFWFDGFHLRIGWNQAGENNYIGTYEIDDPNVFKEETLKGGPGSGNFGHSGRPGKVGGSASSIMSGLSKYATNPHKKAMVEDAEDGLQKVLEAFNMQPSDVTGVSVFGSFITDKPDPGDIDVLLEVADTVNYPGLMARSWDVIDTGNINFFLAKPAIYPILQRKFAQGIEGKVGNMAVLKIGMVE